jgi:hypothetical protein
MSQAIAEVRRLQNERRFRIEILAEDFNTPIPASPATKTRCPPWPPNFESIFAAATASRREKSSRPQ